MVLTIEEINYLREYEETIARLRNLEEQIKLMGEAISIDRRAVQRAGRGSYVISLPKEWVTQLGITKGQELTLLWLKDRNRLVVFP